MLFYDVVKFLKYNFYLVVENDSLKYCSIDDYVISGAVLNREKLLPYTTWLQAYLNGSNKPHNFKMILNNTNFINDTHLQLMKIPYGKTSTYKGIALELERPKSARPVGNAVGKNNQLIFIPCHRIIKSDGGMGGFSSDINLKKILLDLESPK